MTLKKEHFENVGKEENVLYLIQNKFCHNGSPSICHLQMLSFWTGLKLSFSNGKSILGKEENADSDVTIFCTLIKAE